ncbi:cyclic pyranopterin monophosphate synthase MoaC [Listeria monocytogenes]|uniref:cyclic pyranopterin monophosphate synthase MoaC n=1 Tax=Listeria monocytogenes TaxID=1639 RepID=UPI001248DB83|nr:cyclic pyranopterin monophosphate synthase MoaC [Listeria monocytogenes]MPR50060.1 cyclic pyranopterin monophosphate synthase MoaC [Listeria monocytogenes]MPR54061.1 cyclic pyranopterin monophosphate synthase MoaC [Listeria monocytogenes]MPR57125.1 cyclic pyranopterin monophosphate synthase MoaC [Listeria monocytogenes]MPR58970.1 cyclic pyranopterin monophosphate synthase MoaC [Listeria monocytogenes]MPR75165.1 cyclic pyranopterin monophosphate synthase MoaC [Listeria monocytogenes]
MEKDDLTHFNDEKRAKMVDVTSKSETKRRAIARATIYMNEETLARIHAGKIAKGDVLAVAQVAGIMAAKKTSELIPMCHPIMTTKADISFEDDGKTALTITSEVVTVGKTGVEMEALTAVTIAALTIYDMCKAMDKGMRIEKTYLVEKTGGKSGTFKAEA